MTLLADLNLKVLPYDVLLIIRDAVKNEIQRRDKYSGYQRALAFADNPNPPCMSYEDGIAAAVHANSIVLSSMPAPARRGELARRLQYFSSVVGQNWTHLFPESNDILPACYVYAHIDPRTQPLKLNGLDTVLDGRPFYIGKGSGSRAWDLKRNQGHAQRIRRIRNAGYPDTSLVQIIAEEMTERQALALEAKLIYFFGSIYDEGTQGCLVNLADHVRPIFTRHMPRIPSPFEWHRNLRKAISTMEGLPH